MRRALVGAAGVLTALLLASGGAPARTLATPPGCAPAGPDECTKLLEPPITVPAGGGRVTTATVFRPGESYRLVITGSVHQVNSNLDYDAFYCFDGPGCTPEHTCGVCLLTVDGGGLVPNEGIAELGYGCFCPPYSRSHTYALPYSEAGGPLKPLNGKLTFGVAVPSGESASNYSGFYTVQVYGAAARTETIRFAGSVTSHNILVKGGAFILTTMKALGQLSVRVPAAGSEAVSTTAGGAVTIHKVKLSAKGVLIFDFDNLALKIASARFADTERGAGGSRGPRVVVSVVVSRTADAATCPLGTRGTVFLEDGSPVKKADVMGINLARCGGLHGLFTNGRQAANVAVGISGG